MKAVYLFVVRHPQVDVRRDKVIEVYTVVADSVVEAAAFSSTIKLGDCVGYTMAHPDAEKGIHQYEEIKL